MPVENQVFDLGGGITAGFNKDEAVITLMQVEGGDLKNMILLYPEQVIKLMQSLGELSDQFKRP